MEQVCKVYEVRLKVAVDINVNRPTVAQLVSLNVIRKT
jgi:hypothetical protein